MAEPAVYIAKDKPWWIKSEHTELKPAEVTKDKLNLLSDTSLELDKLSDTNLELDELSDANLDLDELSDTEKGNGLDAGWNGPFSLYRSS